MSDGRSEHSQIGWSSLARGSEHCEELGARDAARLLGRLSVLVAMAEELEAIGASPLRRAMNAQEIARLRLRLERSGIRDLNLARHLGAANGDLADATSAAES
jgi:hypothetical protein